MIFDWTKRGARGRRTHATAPDPVEVMRWPLPSLQRAGHVLTLAASGSGKTVATTAAIVAEIAATKNEPAPPSFLIVDAKSDLVQGLWGALIAAGVPFERIHYLNPFNAFGFPFNLVHLPNDNVPVELRAAQIAGIVARVSTAAGDVAHLGMGARQVQLLSDALLAVLDCDKPDANLLWVLDGLTERHGLQRLAGITRSERAKQALVSANPSDQILASTSSRVRTAFATTRRVENMLSVPRCLSFEQLLAPGNVVLVDLGAPPAGLVSVQQYYANLVLRLAIEHLMARPSPFPGHATRIVVDEAHLVAPVLADGLASHVLPIARSKAVSVVLITQSASLLADASPLLLRVLMGNVPLKWISRLAAPEAEQLAHEIGAGPGVEEPVGALRTRFASTVANLQDREFIVMQPGSRQRVRSPDQPLGAWAAVEAEAAADIQAVVQRYAVTDMPRVPLPPLPKKPRRTRPPRKNPGGAQAPPDDQPPAPPRPPRGKTRWG